MIKARRIPARNQTVRIGRPRPRRIESKEQGKSAADRETGTFQRLKIGSPRWFEKSPRPGRIARANGRLCPGLFFNLHLLADLMIGDACCSRGVAASWGRRVMKFERKISGRRDPRAERPTFRTWHGQTHHFMQIKPENAWFPLVFTNDDVVDVVQAWPDAEPETRTAYPLSNYPRPTSGLWK